MSDFKFINGIFAFLDAADGVNTTSIECESKIDHYLFYQFCLIPAVVLTLMMAATKSRIQMLREFLNGRPGLVFPMDTLTRSSRVSYCCAFGVTGFTIYQIVWNGKFAIDYHGPIALKTLIVLVSVLIYGMVFFPVFTSLALGTAFSFFLGSLYVWMFFAIEVYKVNECDFNAAWRAVLLLRGLPNLLCLAYLSIAMPVKFCLAVRRKKYFTPSLGESAYCETLGQIKRSYQGKHVTKLLQKPEVVVPAEGLLNSLKAGFNRFLETWIYHGESGFRYPSRLTSVMFIAACVIYVISVELLVMIITFFKSIMDPIKAAMDAMNVEDGEYAVQYVFFYVTQIFQVSSIIAVTLSSAIIFMSILHMMSSFRTNLFALYRGDYTYIPAPETKGAIALCTGSIKYAGFQVAYIISGFIMIGIVLFIICLSLAVIITVLTLGFTNWLVDIIKNYWPGLIVAIVFFVLQTLLAKFVFLQDRGQHLRLDNRRFYFVVVYFMFFYNIFLGLFSCVLRIIKALAVGLLFLPRLDNSTLPRKFEFFDPGFSAYQGYIHMEAAHTHPVVIVFIRLLTALSKDRRRNTAEEKELEKSNFAVSFDTDVSIKESDASSQSDRPVNVSARFNWFVMYTLLHNPAVRIYRKGFMQSIKKARLEGIKIPISDKPVTDFDLVKMQQERDKVREEEAMRNSPAHSLYNGMAAMGSMVGSPRHNGIANKPSKKTSRKPKIFRKWRIKTGCGKLATVDNVSQELDNYTRGSYAKNENV